MQDGPLDGQIAPLAALPPVAKTVSAAAVSVITQKTAAAEARAARFTLDPFPRLRGQSFRGRRCVSTGCVSVHAPSSCVPAERLRRHDA